MEPREPSSRDVPRRLSRRQLRARADGALRAAAAPGRPPAPDELVPLPRPGLAAVPPLPGPAGHAHRRSWDWAPAPTPPFGSTLYLLLVLWPLSVYASAAALRPRPRRVAAGQPRPSPLLMSAVGVGLRAQGLRVDRLRRVGPAVGVVDAPAGVGLHLAGHGVAPGRAPGRGLRGPHHGPALRDRLPGPHPHRHLPLPRRPSDAAGPPARAPRRGRWRRCLVSAWVTVPLLAQGRWAATNEILAHTPLVNGYGAKQVMSLARRRASSSTPIGSRSSPSSPAPGSWCACVRLAYAARGRALVALLAMSLLLSFGRTTFGSLTVLLPGSKRHLHAPFHDGRPAGAACTWPGWAAWCGRMHSWPASGG